MYRFQVDHRYTRKDVYKIIGIPVDTKGGNWDTGYNKYKDDFFIFTNIGMPVEQDTIMLTNSSGKNYGGIQREVLTYINHKLKSC